MISALGASCDMNLITDVPLSSTSGRSLKQGNFSRTPTASRVLRILEEAHLSPVCFDHVAYRTFKLKGMGIQSIAQRFKDVGFVARDNLHFPGKHVTATWFRFGTLLKFQHHIVWTIY
jgi:hypothetical protein